MSDAAALAAPTLAERAAAPLLYLLAIALAELLTAAVDPRLGLPLHAVILLAVLIHGASVADDARRALLWSLALAPLIRILSLSLPLDGSALVFWYALISIPIFAATSIAARTLGYDRRDLGLAIHRDTLPLDLALLGLGLLLGIVEYAILRPRPLVRSLDPTEIWLPIAILTISTGFEEELVFRGLLQRAAVLALGPLAGLLYITVLFTVLHTGYLSPLDQAFVFLVGLLFACVARRTGSILGTTLAHAGVNVGLFVIWPFVLPAWFG